MIPTSRAIRRRLRKHWITVICTVLHCGWIAAADPVEPQQTVLPPLLIHGTPARAHTQGIEWIGTTLYVTARREDVSPKQPLLLRTTAGGDHWDVWDLTLTSDADAQTMDHPGGFQSDGTHLWIPQAQSRRNGRTRIRALRLDTFNPGRLPKATLEFPVADHIGAVAVAPERNQIYGASWDTETVWVWTMEGTLIEKRSAEQLRPLNLGIETGERIRAGLTVQDWKWMNNQLVASGLWKTTEANSATPRSRVVVYPRFLEPNTPQMPRWIPMPKHDNKELSNEGMAIARGRIWFLPEDLGATNRLFSLPWPIQPAAPNPQ